ncbi:MAG: MBL fold metallo-hydrolase [Defluviitaleaceae bacterium]|nr:MBL fold metallo-hydrolase [Defluviitaleaceae bacterium]
MSINFCTIASGSSGNSVFVSTDQTKILIDAGLSGRAIETNMAGVGINCADLTAIFITHEHTDHIQGAGVLSRRYNVPLYLTRGTWQYAQKYGTLGKIAQENQMMITPDTAVILGDMKVKPFAIPHDAAEPVGYTIQAHGRKIAVATDLGHINPNVAENFYDADIVMIESNHDLDMLQYGPYPAHLKRRILSDIGHLSNVSCGAFLADIFGPKTKYIFLAHLSQENNRPVVAYETVKNILTAKNIDAGGSVGLYLADRYKTSGVLTLH